MGIDPYAAGMDANGTSKAKRLRHIWSTQSNYRVGQLLSAMLDLEEAEIAGTAPSLEKSARQRARDIADRLRQGGLLEDADALIPNSPERSFELLAKEVKEAIEQDQPEVALDRLHTFAVKYVRTVYERHFGKTANRDATANSLFGEYANDLKSRGLIDSKMTAEILKSSGRVLDAFNYVRNNQSLAHDNRDIFNRREARFIYANVAGSIRFLGALNQEVTEIISPATVDVPI